MAKRIIIGIDPGFSGGITIMKNGKADVYEMPVRQIIMSDKRKKKEYDIQGVVSLLSPLSGDVVVSIEKVHAGPGEGTVSMFNFGKGYGILLGVVHTLGFEVHEVMPQTWKKTFPELRTDEIDQAKALQKDLRARNKSVKEKEKKKQNTKEIERLARQVKSLGKDAARDLAGKLYPKLIDRFKLKKSDGLADSLLIAEHIKRAIDNELV